ncbi:MAG TPA: IS1634 family transposase [Acidiferrobacterales bacterium]|nr:IS1634 family transposase [Acidiferrobacterales bacterium]
MYLRHTTRRKDGKTHIYWQLVRSIRHGRKVVQETVAQLGELDAEGRARATQLAREITGCGREGSQGHLFDSSAPVEAVKVRLDAVRVERSRSFGAVWLGWKLWCALKLDELLGALLPRGREAVAWAEVIAILAIGRLCEPSSELHVAEQWYRTTALEDLLGVTPESVYDERLYRSLDRLLPHKEAIEAHLVKRFGELFDLDYDLLLYDVTSTYFEGVADPEIAKRGYSRDHRPDCVQVNIALVVTREGMPLGYEIFPGNTTDVTTVQKIVSGMEARFGKANRVWVMDRGMASQENLDWLNETGRRYVIGTPKSELKRWAKQIEDSATWRRIRGDVEVKVCRGPDSTETFLLCRSAARVEKERAMHDRFKAHIETALASLERRIAKAKKPLDRGAIERQIGRLLERNSRAAGAFLISITEDLAHPSGIRMTKSYRPEWADWARLTEGVYILRTNITEWTDEALWQTYIQLTEAEAAFRIHKSDLAIRPIWHHKQGRIKAHILICFIAYALWKTLQQWQSKAGLGHAPRILLTEFSRIHAADIVLPLAENTQRELRIRCVVRPDKAQAILLERLGLTLPQRLKVPAIPEM